jgi:diacylglycerol O-acyltransferase / wax synthase
MSNADAAWLRMDRPQNLMVINGVLSFDQQVDWERLRGVLRERLVDPFPRFRQRVREPRLGIGAPQWEDDPAFDLDLHLHHVALPAPGDRAALEAFVGDRMAMPLDRARALWEFHFVDGYGEGCAVVARMHHAIADGIALARVLFSLTDAGPEPGATGEVFVQREGGTLDAVTRPVGAAVSLGRGLAGTAWHEGIETLAHPRHAAEIARTAGDDMLTLAKVLAARPDTDTVLRGSAGIAERVAWSDPFALEPVRDLAHAHGATVNDVLVAATTGALRTYLLDRDSLVDEIHAIVPFNLRPLDEPLPRDLGNRFGLVTLPLPVGIAQREGRLHEVMRAMGRIKTSPEGPISYALLGAIGVTPAPVEAALVGVFSGVGSTVLTNVPGPRETIYLAGSPVRGALVWAPVSGNVAMSVSIFSYAGSVTIGVMTDAGLVPDPAAIVSAFTEELAALSSL